MRTAIVCTIAAIFAAFSAGICLADEAADHICFRALDVNKDGVLTREEYHGLLGHGAS